MAEFDALRATLTDIAERGATPQPSKPAPMIRMPLLDQRMAAEAEIDRILPSPGPAPTNDVPEIPQPQTTVGVAKAAVKEDRAAVKAAARPEFAALTEELVGPQLPQLDLETQSVEEVEEMARRVSETIAEEDARRAGPIIDTSKGVGGNVVNLGMKLADIQEDIGVVAASMWNSIGVKVNVPGQMEDEKAAAIYGATHHEELRKEVERNGLNSTHLRFDISPQGNVLGLEYWKTYEAFRAERERELRAKLVAEHGDGTPEDFATLRQEAHDYADKAVRAVVAGTVGRNFAIVTRGSVPGETARWIQEYPPLVRPWLTGVWQDNADVILPNGRTYEQDLTQNTLFGALDYGFNAISPAFKPFAAGAHTGRNLSGADVRTYLADTFWAPELVYPMLSAMIETVPDFETDIPFDLQSEEAIQHMMEGKADIVNHHDALGGAAARALLAEPGEDASDARKAANLAAKVVSKRLGFGAFAQAWGWSDAEVLGVMMTGGAVAFEPDGFTALGPAGKGVKALGEMKHFHDAAKVLQVTENAINKLDAATDLKDITPAAIANDISSITGGAMAGPIIERMHSMRVTQLMGEDEDVLNAVIATAERNQAAADNLKDADAAEKANNSPELRALAKYNIAKARVDAARAQQDAADIEARLLEYMPGFAAGKGVDEAAEATNLKNATKLQVDARAKIDRLIMHHGNKLAEAKDARKLVDDLGAEVKTITDEASRLITDAADEARRLGDDLTALGIDPPTTKKAERQLFAIHSDASTVAAIKAYRDARANIRALRRQYTPLKEAARNRHAAAKTALLAYAPMDKVQKRLNVLRKTLRAAAADASAAAGRLDSGRKYKQAGVARANQAKAVAAEKAALAAAAELRKVVGDAARGVSSRQAYIDAIGPDKYRGYAKQALREILEGVRDGHKSLMKVGDVDYGAAEEAVLSSTSIIDGARKFDGDEFAKQLAKITDEPTWRGLRDGQRRLIERALASDTLIGTDVAHLKRAINQAGRIFAAGARTPADELGEVFWRTVSSPDTPVWGNWITKTYRQALRSTLGAFGLRARIGEVAPHAGRLAVETNRASKRIQQELYEVLSEYGIDAPDAKAGRIDPKFGHKYVDSTDGIETRSGATFMNQGDESIFERFVARATNIAEVMDSVDDMALVEDARDLHAVARAFMPDGLEYTDLQGVAVLRAVLRSIQKRPPASSAKLYNSLPHIVAETLSDVRGGLTKDEYLRRAQNTRHQGSNVAGYFAGIAQSSLMHRLGDELGALALGSHKLEDIQAANNLMLGQMKGALDVEAGVRVLNSMDLTINPRGGGELGDRMHRLVVMSNSPEGAVFAPKALIDEVNESIDGMVKELAAVNTAGRMPTIVRGFLGGLRATLAAVAKGLVRGYVIPRLKRFTNATVGNFAQIWSEEGLSTAMSVAVKSAPANIAWVMPKRAIQAGHKVQEALAKKLGGAPVLGGALESMANPHSGRIFAGESGTMTLGGREFTYDEIRKMAVYGGLMENTLRTEFGPQMITLMKGVDNPDRFLSGKWAKKIAKAMRINDEWVTRSIETMEQRQRLELFLNLLDKGVDPEAANRRTLNALYDWSSPIAHWEATLFANWIPFYRVFRNSGAHAVRMLTEPFTAPTADYMARGMMGQTRLGRVRTQYNLSRLYASEGDADPNTPGRQTRRDIHPADFVAPGWLSARAASKLTLVQKEHRAFLEENLGHRVTLAVTMHPNIPTLEGLDMLGSIAMAMGAITLVSLDQAGAFVGLTEGERTLPSNFAERVSGGMLDYVGLAGPEVLKAVTSLYDGDVREMSTITKGEAAAIDLLPDFVFGGVREMPDGTLEANTRTRGLIRLIPVLGPQMLDMTKAYFDKAVTDDEVERVYRVVSHLVGASRTYYSDSEENLNRRVKDTARALEQARQGLDGVERPD